MKIFTLIYVLLIVGFSGNSQTMEGLLAADIEFSFALTTDVKFCNPDSVVGTDCGGGRIYLTKNGKAYYTFFCMGDDTTRYLIGKYKIIGKNIKCLFNSKYEYYISEYGVNADGAPIDPNIGRLFKTKSVNLELLRIECKEFSYAFVTDQGEKYVLKKTSKEEIYFRKRIQKIKILN